VRDLTRLTDLTGKVALVSGGSAGIGYAIAETYAEAGAAVCIVARREDVLAGAVARLSQIGPKVVGHAGSIADEGVRAASVQRCIDELGGLDILVNNAATQGPLGSLGTAPAADVVDTWNVNQVVPLRYAQLAWEAAMAEHGGSILNIVSLAGIRTRQGFGAYGVSKAALVHLTKQLALDLAPGVRVNAIAPGLVKTEMAQAALDGRDEEREAAKRPLGRLGLPDDIAGAALFLASDASAWTTGQVVAIDGGALLR
jgi:3-oxoacyl-[acyl-carrier protein] reductase